MVISHTIYNKIQKFSQVYKLNYVSRFTKTKPNTIPNFFIIDNVHAASSLKGGMAPTEQCACYLNTLEAISYKQVETQ